MKALFICSLAIAVASCSQKPKSAQCPDPQMVAPASVGGASEVQKIASTLSGPDRENAITEAARALHSRDPALGSDRITDILIAADCESQSQGNAVRVDPTKNIQVISRQVEAIMSGVPKKDK